MRVDVSSNILTGAYACFEVLLAIVLSSSITTLVGCWNIKKLYDDKRNLCLVPDRLQLISNHGVTSRNVHNVATLVFLIVTLLMACGGFSMVGLTVDNRERINVPFVVRKAAPDYVLNVTEHVSLDNNKVSGTLVLLRRYTGCLKWQLSTMQIFEYFYNGSDLSSIKWSPQTNFNITCMASGSGYAPHVALRRKASIFVVAGQEACQWKVEKEATSVGTVNNPPITLSGGCAGELQEAWCFRSNEADIFCAGIMRNTESLVLSTYVENGENSEGKIRSANIDPSEGIDSESLKSMTRLMASEISTSPSSLVIMLSLSIQRNGNVTRISEKRQVTRINTRLLLGTLVPALAISVAVFAATLAVWIKVILVPGRQRYNRFNSTMDLLSCAAAEKWVDSGLGHLRRSQVEVEVEEQGELHYLAGRADR